MSLGFDQPSPRDRTGPLQMAVRLSWTIFLVHFLNHLHKSGELFFSSLWELETTYEAKNVVFHSFLIIIVCF